MAAELSLIVGDVNIAELSDEELYQKLTDGGAVVGPIVGTTRKTYERKLAVLMGATVSNYSFTEQANTTANEDMDDAEPSQAYLARLTSGAQIRRRNVTAASQSMTSNMDDDDEDFEDDGGDGTYSAGSSPLYTPSPRPPIRSANSSYSSSTRHQESYLSSPEPATKHNRTQDESVVSEKSFSPLITMAKILFALSLLLVLYFYIFSSEKDAFASLEHLAQTAADTMEKKKGGVAPPPSDL